LTSTVCDATLFAAASEVDGCEGTAKADRGSTSSFQTRFDFGNCSAHANMDLAAATSSHQAYRRTMSTVTFLVQCKRNPIVLASGQFGPHREQVVVDWWRTVFVKGHKSRGEMDHTVYESRPGTLKVQAATYGVCHLQRSAAVVKQDSRLRSSENWRHDLEQRELAET